MLIGLAAAAGVLALTRPPGPGLEPDSMSYLGAAQSLVHAGTLRIPTADWDDADSTQPLHHFPPGFSIAVAAPVAAGLSPAQGGRWVMAAGAAVAAGVCAWLVDLAAGWAAGVVTVVLLALMPAIVSVHVEVLSEPLFLAILAVMLALMLRQPGNPLAYGTAAALGALVRYAGLSFAGAAAIWAYRQGGTTAERVRRAALALAPTVCLFGAWVVRTAAERESIRSVGLFPGIGDNLRALGGTLADQLVPWVDSPVLRWVLTPLVAALVVALLRSGVRRARAKDKDAAARRLFAALGVVAACYAAELVLARLLADPGIPFDGRLLAPLILLAVVGAGVALGLGWREWRAPERAGAALALAMWASAAGAVLAEEYAEIREHGTGYSSDEWRESAISRWLRSEGPRYALFTNHPMNVYIQTGRASRELPDALSEDVVSDFREMLRQRHGVVVGFRNGYRPSVSPDTLAARLGLVPVVRSPEGTVWELPGAP